MRTRDHAVGDKRISGMNSPGSIRPCSGLFKRLALEAGKGHGSPAANTCRYTYEDGHPPVMNRNATSKSGETNPVAHIWAVRVPLRLGISASSGIFRYPQARYTIGSQEPVREKREKVQ